MLHSKRKRKSFAATMLLVMLINTFAPTISYALTSGPTAPEATSFEPVDTTDMVNMQTGDFTYNIPLMEVPGPEGGYPLSLSYHAGIQPNEDASWVGLGWSLNPGAITRNVNSYPDDWHDVTQVVRDYWSGGETKTFGINIGVTMGAANVSFGLSFSQDTYKGFGIGFSTGIGIGPKVANGNLSLSISPYGDDVSFGMSVTVGIFSLKTDMNTLTGSIDVGSLGISMSTENEVTVSAMGASVSLPSGTSAGKIQTRSKGFNLYLEGGVSISWNTTRYWSDETSDITTHGALYMRKPELGVIGPLGQIGPVFHKHSFDVYHLPDDPAYNNIVDYPDPRRVPGGSFPDNDVYQVSAQGLSGSFRPYVYQERLYMQTIRSNENGAAHAQNYQKEAQSLGRSIDENNPYGTSGKPTSQIQYRFVNDFSNSYRQTAPAYSRNGSNDFLYNFGTSTWGENDGNYGFNPSLNKLAGSRNIEFFTNKQINSSEQDAKAKGFINISSSAAKGFTRNSDDLTGGFSITNESGVTYHYALPAYSYGEVSYSENMPSERPAKGYIWNKVYKPAKYAYTWFLTSITGPDFVDRNNDGIAGAGDWGYYVNFEYGKWNESYGWRNPSEGYHRDLDTKFQNYSKGKKEIYYLNAVKTRSHTAIFEKSLRHDAKSIVIAGDGLFDHDGTMESLFTSGSRSSMRLDKIFLFSNKDFDALQLNTNTAPEYNQDIPQSVNVFDKYDVDVVRLKATNSAIKVVDLNYDYSLAPNTSNSFETNTPAVKMGKLTLNSVLYRGKNGSAPIPPTRFYYELDESEIKNGFITFSGYNSVSNTTQISASGIEFELGEIVKFNGVAGPDYGTIVQKSSATQYVLKFIRNHTRNHNGNTHTVSTTKNPWYSKDYQDSWGLFKSDYDPALKDANENLSKITSVISAKSTDVWSLRKIKNPAGSVIKIRYESDTYRKSVLNNYLSLVLQKQSMNMSTMEMTFNVLNDQNIPLSNYLSVGQDITADIIACEMYRLSSSPYYLNYPSATGPITPSNTQFSYKIVSLTGNTLKVKLELRPGSINVIGTITDLIILANLQLNDTKNFEFFGGGLRVKSLDLEGGAGGTIKRTAYEYKGANSTVSSGVTAFQPQVLDTYDEIGFKSLPLSGNAASNEDMQKQMERLFKRELYRYMDYLLAMSRELPPPGVLYEYVTVINQVKNPQEPVFRNMEGKAEYQYEVFDPSMIGVYDYSPRIQESVLGSQHYVRNMSIRNTTTRLGLLKRTINYDVQGRKIKEKIQKYLHDDLIGQPFSAFIDNYSTRLSAPAYNSIGLIQERFQQARNTYKNTYIQPNNWVYSTILTMSMREEYPVVSLGEKVIDYVNGITTSSENVGFDFYSGAVTKSVETDVYGNRFLTEKTPAYRIYSEMGLKGMNTNNKNMLKQEAARFLYKVDANNNKLGIVSANVQLWGNDKNVLTPDGSIIVQNVNNNTQGNVWRMKGEYSWMPNLKTNDGIQELNSFVQYNFSNPGASNANWKLITDQTLFDVYSKSIESRDANGNYSASKLGYDVSKVLVSGTMSRHNEMAYSGAEDLKNGLFGTDVTPGNGIVESVSSYPNLSVHTGLKSLRVAAGQSGFTYSTNLVTGKHYLASVWVKSANGQPPSGAQIEAVRSGQPAVTASISSKVANGWYLVQLNVPASAVAATTIKCKNTGSGDLLFDDFRFQPLNAVTTAYVYDPATGELIYLLGNNNLFTRYEYDEAGRIVREYKEQLNVGEYKVKEHRLNFGGTKFTNAAINKTFKPHCPAGYLGADIVIQVPANTFSSYYSQEDADAIANNYAQTQANATGVCNPLTVYVRIESANPSTGGSMDCSYTQADIYLKFYANPECTIPLTLPRNLDISYSKTLNWSGIGSGSNTTNHTVLATTGINQLFLERAQTYSYCDYYDEYFGRVIEIYELIYELKPGSGYTIASF